MSIELSEIEATLQDALMPRALEVVDDSHQHASHYVGRGVSHISIWIDSAHLEGLSRIEKTRVVMRVLDPYLVKGLHAVRVTFLPPPRLP